MEAVNILIRIDQRQHARFIQMLWKRKLHEDTVHAGIGIELPHGLLKRLLGAVRCKTDHHGADGGLAAGIFFISDIDLACSVFPHEHHSQMRRYSF